MKKLFIILHVVIFSSTLQASGPSNVTSTVGGIFTPQWSESQLSAVPAGEFLIVPGTSLDTDTTIIPDRYKCSDIEGTFAIDGTDNKKLILTLSTTWSLGDDPKCDVDWGDGSSEEVVFDPDPSIDVEHTYTDFGVYVLKFSCTDDAGNSQGCPVQNSGCSETAGTFDAFFQSINTPLKCFVHERLQIDSFLSLKDSCLTQKPVIHWRFDRINGSTIESFTNFTQPNNSVLIFEPYLLEPGLYILYLELTFHHISTNVWNADYILINILLPELVATISGGTLLTVPHGTTFTVDASRSNDPVAALESLMDVPLIANWSFVNYALTPIASLRNVFTKSFPTVSLPAGGNTYVIQDGDEYLLTVDSTFFPKNTWCVVMFSLTRGERASSVIQWIQLVENSIPVTLSCIKNCHAGRERKFLDDEIMFDSVLPQELENVTGVTYSWTISRLAPLAGNVFVAVLASTSTGVASRSIGINKGALIPGTHYRIRLQVSAPGYAASTVSAVGTVNYVPYGGTCTLDRMSGVAASDWFVFECSGWKGADDRITTNAVADVNPFLIYSISQMTVGAVLESEPILFTRAKKSYLIVKVGDPDNSYQTTLFVSVSDLYKNSVQIPIIIQALPAFDWTAVDATQAGADLVSAYKTTDFTQSENNLRTQGKVDMLVPLVSSVASHIHLIHLPVWEPPVPRELTNDEGSILDLNPAGNKDVGGLDKAVDDSTIETVDPATIALQQAVTEITEIIDDITWENLINGTRGEEKRLISMITNSLSNLAATDQYVNESIKPTLIFLGQIVGENSLVSTSENSTTDDSAEIAIAAGDVNQMTKQVVRTVVPNTLNQLRAITGFQQGRTSISNMLDVSGQNISLENSTMTPEERAFLYYRMQLALAYETEGKRETAKQAASMAIGLARKVQDVLKLCSLCSNEDSNNTEQLVLNNKIANLTEKTIMMKNSSFVLDGLANTLGENNSSGIASASALELDENVFMYDNDKESSRVSSKILHIDVKSDGQLISPGNITYSQQVETPEAQVVTPFIEPDDASQFSYHQFIYQSAKDQVCIILRPDDVSKVKEYAVYVNLYKPPTLLSYEFFVNVSADSDWQVCILPHQMKGHTGKAYLGVQVPTEIQTVKYHFNLITVACMVWEEDSKSWLSDKCDLLWKPDEGQLQCKCREVKDLTFGNSFFVAPNSIDFSTVFLKFSPLNQAAVIGVLSGLFFIFLLVILWAIGADRNDFYKWSITPLQDNYYKDHHYYIIKVFTGMRHGAGTRSRIAFNIFGLNQDTGPRELYDGLREVFPTGSVLTFLMATNGPLGHISHLRIWHDNSGEGSYGSWYLNQIMIYDIRFENRMGICDSGDHVAGGHISVDITACNVVEPQQKYRLGMVNNILSNNRNMTVVKLYIFPCERWLSVETSLEANLTSVTQGKPVQFESRFFNQARGRLSENHMWMSILYRPVSSTFSRVERAACALAYILLTMVSNAMYYDTGSDYELPAIFEFGPFRFTTQQLYVSLICALITTPVMMLIITIFKRTRRKPEIPGESKKCFCCGYYCYGKPHDPFMEKILLSKGVMDQHGFYFPHVFVFIAWFLVFGGIVTSAFFIMLFSMSWGKQKSEEWLTSFLMSLLESVTFVDPMMVLLLSLVFAMIFKINKEVIRIDFVTLIRNYRRMVDRNAVPKRTTSRPLDGSKLEEEARVSRNRQMAYTALRDIALNLFFLWILCSIGYSNRDSRSYYHHRFIENLFVTPRKLPQFGKIKTPGDVYTWLNKTVFPSLFPEVDINGDPLHWRERQYMTGIHSYRLGPPRLRQLRVSKGICHIPTYGSEICYGQYSISGEDTRDFCTGWNPLPCSLAELTFGYSPGAWNFTSAFDIWGLPITGVYTTYGGGGYTAQFDINRNTSIRILNELFTNIWLDRHTRAVILEFTLYTPNTNLFIYNMFMVEFPETGGAFTSFSILPLRVYHHYGPGGTYTLICECILLVYLIILLSKICIRFYQQGCQYFKKVWQVYELVQFLVGVTAVVVYFFRLGFTTLTINKFNADKKLFVNFQHIAFWDLLLVLFLGILLFMATIRILQVFETSKKVNAVIKIFSDCATDLFWFGMMFLFIFIGFCFLGTLLFGSALVAYKNVFQSMGTLFISLIGKSNYTEISAVTPILANIFFIAYILTTVFFILTIFLSILGGSIDSVIHDTRTDNSDDIMHTLMLQFQKIVWRPKKNAKSKSKNIKQIQVAPLQEKIPENKEKIAEVPPAKVKIQDQQEQQLQNILLSLRSYKLIHED